MTGAFDAQVEAASISSLQNIEAELGFLCALIAENRLIEAAADKCRPGDFSVPVHGRVFAAMIEQAAAGGAVDAVTLAPLFRDDEGWPAVQRRLAGAFLNDDSRAITKAYLKQITMLSSRRRLVAGLQDVILSARNLDIAHAELVANADEAVASLVDGHVDTRQAPASAYAQLVIDNFGKPIVGVRCGIIGSLDDAIGVLRPSDFIVVGGRPGMGKTATIGSYSLGAASRGHATLIFSLEMSGEQLAERMLSDLCFSVDGGVPYEDIRDRRVTGANLAKVQAAQKRLIELPLEISDASGLTLPALVRRTRSHKRKLAVCGRKLELVIVDYLQLMAPSRSGMSLYEHASEVSKGLKDLAKAEELTVIAVAQLSRDLERRPDKRPVPSDLRDSGQIEQDADAILFVYREEEYLKRTEPTDEFGPKYESWRTDMEAVRNKIEFIVPKRRTGPSGKSVGWFFGANSAVRGADFYRLGGGGGNG